MKKLLPLFLLILLLSSCGFKGIAGELFELLPDTISSVGEFFHAWFVLLILSIGLSLIGSFILGKGSYVIVTIILFIAILVLRDYGFFKTLLLFILEGVVLFVINLILVLKRRH